MPALRDVLQCFQRSEYGACLIRLALGDLHVSLMLKVHLSSHVPALLEDDPGSMHCALLSPVSQRQSRDHDTAVVFIERGGIGGGGGGLDTARSYSGLHRWSVGGSLISVEFNDGDGENDSKNVINQIPNEVDKIGDRCTANVQSRLLRMNCREQGSTVGALPVRDSYTNPKPGQIGTSQQPTASNFVEYCDSEDNRSDEVEIESAGGEYGRR